MWVGLTMFRNAFLDVGVIDGQSFCLISNYQCFGFVYLLFFLNFFIYFSCLLCRSMWFHGFACLLGVGETLFFF